MAIKITHRDLDIIRWINGFGFVETKHIVNKFKISEGTAYTRLKKLVSHGYLKFERIFHGKSGIYRATKLGVNLTNDILPPIKKVKISQYHHDLVLIDLSIILAETIGGTFITERHIRHEKGLKGVGQRGHISDAELVLDNKKIAIEMELSSKGKTRRRSILNFYLRKFEYKELWYFCGSSEIQNQIKPLITKLWFVKLFDLDTILENRSLQ